MLRRRRPKLPMVGGVSSLGPSSRSRPAALRAAARPPGLDPGRLDPGRLPPPPLPEWAERTELLETVLPARLLLRPVPFNLSSMFESSRHVGKQMNCKKPT
mmetsp:Transcript_54111/g.107719  ORF Transcript_54111/g.107719 Transcript_54111/m.107719 type:complete len:101 (-) Transcript_54111:2104-2406(-)